MNRPFDFEAEKIFIRALLHGVEFSNLIEHIAPEMLYGAPVNQDWQSVANRHVYDAIRTLYVELRGIPSKDSVVARVGIKPIPFSGVSPQMSVSFVERIYNEGSPASSDAIDARIRIYNCYTYRYAVSLMKEAAAASDKTDGESLLRMLHEKSVLKGGVTKDYKAIDYFAAQHERAERIRSIQRGDDTGVQKVPFGIRGLDIETDGGMSPGELVIGCLPPGRGKTVCLQDSCAYNVERGVGCVFFTKEMNENEIGLRFDSRFTGIAHPKFYAAKITDQDFAVWESKLRTINGPLRIVTVYRNFNCNKIREILQSLNWTFDARMIYIDYLNIMEPNDEKDKRKPGFELGGIICEQLKELCNESGLPALTMCQLKPQSADKLKITWDDVAINKLAVSANANVVFAILANEWLRKLNQSVLQILKLRARQPQREQYDMFPIHDLIRIDSNVRNQHGHPAPSLPHSFAPIPAPSPDDIQKAIKPAQVIVTQNGVPVDVPIKTDEK